MLYQHKIVQDLAWALGSPNLIAGGSFSFELPPDAWYQQILTDFHPKLLELDENPKPLEDWIGKRTTRRLGYYFEALWSYWLEHNGRYRKVLENHQVIESKQTVGEIDYIVYDTVDEIYMHWEVAVKFYLAYGDQSQLTSWYGLNATDKLEFKLDRLENHQCRLTQHVNMKELLESKNITISKVYALIKGKLFYPGSENSERPICISESHLKGWWLEESSFKTKFDVQQADFKWCSMSKRDWLNPEYLVGHRDNFNFEKLVEFLNAQNLPVSVVGFDKDIIECGFVVPDNWVKTLNLT